MKVLVINCGSSSVKFQLIETSDGSVQSDGIVERIGFKDAIFTYRIAEGEKVSQTQPVKNHTIAITHVLETLVGKNGVVRNLSEIGAVGHRFVHGGKRFIESVIAGKLVLEEIRKILDLAPLHNPANLLGIEACISAMPATPQVIVFDTAFHAHLKPEVYLYALPYEYYEKYGIRKYGFHGTSHFYVSSRVSELMGGFSGNLRIITCHLGNGCSIDAVHGGRAVDTSMGFTPLEGLMMGTRTGDIDTAAVLYIMKKESLSPEEADTLLNKKSGLLGVSGISSDLREVIEAANSGNERARIALDMYCYRIKKYISAYVGVLGGLDALAFTAGVGEHSPLVRRKVCEGLECLGIEIDHSKNNTAMQGETEINKSGSPARIFVIPTNEEMVIAREAERLSTKQ